MFAWLSRFRPVWSDGSAGPPRAQLTDRTSKRRWQQCAPGYRAAVGLFRAQSYEEASGRFAALIERAHDFGAAHNHSGLCSLRLAKYEEAVDCFTLAACFVPQALQVRLNLAVALARQGRPVESIRVLDEAIALKPHSAAAYNLRGINFLEIGNEAKAAEDFIQAIELNPEFGLAHNNLGYVLASSFGELDRGAWHITRALELSPRNPDVVCNYTMVLMQHGDWDEALSLCNRLLSTSPELHEARLNRALALLASGAFEQGWQDYEARKRARCHFVRRNFGWPEWRGESLSGKAIYVYSEQGLGDEIMFASCFPEIIARARRCVIECSPRLVPLFRQSFVLAEVVARQSADDADSSARHLQIDVQAAAGSLPGFLRPTRASFPREARYLEADPARVRDWKVRLDALGPGTKVGLSWKGGAAATRRTVRSIELDAFGPIWRLPQHTFVSLQYGDVAEDRANACRSHGVAIHHWQQAVDDFVELAALICALDVIVSVCTTVVHLAGALGRSTRVLVPFAPEWRYMARGSTLPWYPNALLYRQTAPGDWAAVIEAIAADLRTRRAAGDVERRPC